jgi:P27 family predicted phage terminase small subunit
VGERGPTPLPTAIRVLRGETKKSRLNLNAPTPAGKPVMPRDMTPAAQKVWRRVIRALGATGVLTAVDTDILRAYCEAVDRYTYAAQTLATTGPMIRGARRGELVKNPLHQIVRDNAVLMRALGRELGLTPSSREGIRLPDSGDPLEAWMSGNGTDG